MYVWNLVELMLLIDPTRGFLLYLQWWKYGVKGDTMEECGSVHMFPVTLQEIALVQRWWPSSKRIWKMVLLLTSEYGRPHQTAQTTLIADLLDAFF